MPVLTIVGLCPVCREHEAILERDGKQFCLQCSARAIKAEGSARRWPLAPSAHFDNARPVGGAP